MEIIYQDDEESVKAKVYKISYHAQVLDWKCQI